MKILGGAGAVLKKIGTTNVSNQIKSIDFNKVIDDNNFGQQSNSFIKGGDKMMLPYHDKGSCSEEKLYDEEGKPIKSTQEKAFDIDGLMGNLSPLFGR